MINNIMTKIKFKRRKSDSDEYRFLFSLFVVVSLSSVLIVLNQRLSKKPKSYYHDMICAEYGLVSGTTVYEQKNKTFIIVCK